MSTYLFLDNYRGFSNTTIQLLDVNFLVGENSTGKTSVLTLLKHFSEPNFLMGPAFGKGGEVQFGHFNEMVSAHAKDRTYFTIGLIEDREDSPKTPKHMGGMLLTYRERSGVPELSRFASFTDDAELNIHFEDEKVLYSFRENRQRTSAEGAIRRLQYWNSPASLHEDGWTEINFEAPAPREQMPLFVSMHLASQNKEGRFPPLYLFSLPSINRQFVWIAPIRTKPRRTYDEPGTPFSSEGLHTPYVIRRMLRTRSEAQKFADFMGEIGKASGLFQAIRIKPFGDSEDAPFEVDAVLDGKPLNLSWVGYGVSQSLPIFVELLDRPKGCWFAIQQPEVHLHPRAQASLGDVFFQMALQDSKRFVIETHSDFTIDRFRMNYRERRKKKEESKLPKSQILFFERRDTRNTVIPLEIGSQGELPPDQPNGYRDFFIKEEIRLLEV